MNDEQLDTLVRGSLERLAADQRAVPDLHQRAIARGVRARRQRNAFVAAALSCVLVTVGVAYAIVPRNTSPSGSGTAALDALVHRVRSLHEELPTPGYWFDESREDEGCGHWQDVSQWAPASGAARRVATSGFNPDGPTAIAAKTLTWRQVSNLPTDPKQLWARLVTLLRDGESSPYVPDTQMLSLIGPLLTDSPVPSADRAAIIQMLGKSPGARIVGSARDLLGRPAFAIDWTTENPAIGGPWTLRLMLDPATGRTLAVRSRTPTSDMGGITFLSAGFATDDHTAPAAWAIAPSAAPTPAPASGPLADWGSPEACSPGASGPSAAVSAAPGS